MALFLDRNGHSSIHPDSRTKMPALPRGGTRVFTEMKEGKWLVVRRLFNKQENIEEEQILQEVGSEAMAETVARKLMGVSN